MLRAQTPQRGPQAAGHTGVFIDCHQDVLEHAQPREQAGDLERSDQARLDPVMHGCACEVALKQKDLACVGFDRTGHHPDQRGLASTIRADEGMARPGLKLQADVVSDYQPTVGFAQRAQFKCCCHEAAYRRSRKALAILPANVFYG